MQKTKSKLTVAHWCDHDRQGTSPERPTHGSLFTGVGLIDYGLEMAGFQTAFQVEIDPYATAVLERHWPGVRRFTDVRECNASNLPHVDILSGGFPCVDISVAGNMEGIGTEEDPTDRSGLWFQFLRLSKELRPFWVLAENFDQLMCSADGDSVLMGLEKAGYDCWPLVMAAEDLGAPHKRQRTFILARNRNAVELPAVSASRRDIIEALDAARAEWLRIKQHLGSMGDVSGDPEVAYGEIVRELRDNPKCTARYRCCGNSVVWPIPALIGMALQSLAERPVEGLGERLREHLASYCLGLPGALSAGWTSRTTPGGWPYHELQTKWEETPLALDANHMPMTRVAGTPSALMPLVKEWRPGGIPNERPGFFQTEKGRWRKVTNSKKHGSANWHQELACRALTQNPALRPTPALCERFMGIPGGWTAAGGSFLSGSRAK